MWFVSLFLTLLNVHKKIGESVFFFFLIYFCCYLGRIFLKLHWIRRITYIRRLLAFCIWPVMQTCNLCMCKITEGRRWNVFERFSCCCCEIRPIQVVLFNMAQLWFERISCMENLCDYLRSSSSLPPLFSIQFSHDHILHPTDAYSFSFFFARNAIQLALSIDLSRIPNILYNIFDSSVPILIYVCIYVHSCIIGFFCFRLCFSSASCVWIFHICSK